MTPLKPTYVGNPIDINPNPTQFTLGSLTTWECRKLQELQHLNMLMESMDPDPDSHIWCCIAVISHKLHTWNKEDVHTKVKVIWFNGEDTWVRLDALWIQDPYPLITYAVKKHLTKHPTWQWTTEFIQDDEHMASMVHAYKASINGVQFMFGVKIPRNVKHALELDKANGNTLWQDSIALELKSINEYQTF